jgi:hypothetical protein
MKKRILLIVALAGICCILSSANCSNPLEEIESQNSPETNPETEYDTIFFTDTLYNIDTTIVLDTVITINSESGWSRLLCSQIASNQPKIVWMFRNEPGNYLIEFTSFLESEHPAQKLSIDIDGQLMTWTPANDPEMTAELALAQNATICIFSHKPPSLGHAIYICMTISHY